MVEGTGIQTASVTIIGYRYSRCPIHRQQEDLQIYRNTGVSSKMFQSQPDPEFARDGFNIPEGEAGHALYYQYHAQTALQKST